jgi:GDP-L-fucose synthase
MNMHGDEEIVNIGTGREITIKELSELIKEIVGFEGSVSFDAGKPNGTPRKLLDVSRLESLGWNARVSLKDGIRETYRQYLKGSRQ